MTASTEATSPQEACSLRRQIVSHFDDALTGDTVSTTAELSSPKQDTKDGEETKETPGGEAANEEIPTGEGDATDETNVTQSVARLNASVQEYLKTTSQMLLHSESDVEVFQDTVMAMGDMLHEAVEAKHGKQAAATVKQDKQTAAFARAAETGSWPSRGDCVANAFNYDIKHSKEIVKELADAKKKGVSSVEEFKKKWASARLEKMQQKLTQTQTFRKVDTSRGQYLTFGGLVTALGSWNWAPAIAGAKEVASQCMAMKGRWLMFHKQAKMPLYLLLSHFTSMRGLILLMNTKTQRRTRRKQTLSTTHGSVDRPQVQKLSRQRRKARQIQVKLRRLLLLLKKMTPLWMRWISKKP